MIQSILVNNRLTLIAGKTRFNSNDIVHSATDENCLAFANAVNSLQVNNPYDTVLRQKKFRLVNV